MGNRANRESPPTADRLRWRASTPFCAILFRDNEAATGLRSGEPDTLAPARLRLINPRPGGIFDVVGRLFQAARYEPRHTGSRVSVTHPVRKCARQGPSEFLHRGADAVDAVQ